MKQRLAEQAQKLTVPQMLELIRAFQTAASETRFTWLAALPLEMAFLEGLQALQAEAQKPPTALPLSQPAAGRSTAAVKAVTREKSDAKAVIPQEPISELLSVPAPAAVEEQGLTLAAVQAHWREIRALVRTQNPGVEALLNSCKPAAVKGRQLFLVFNGEFAKQKMERPEALALVNRAIARTLNCSVEIRCLLRGIQSDELPQGVDHDGVIAEALRLGGEIVDIQD